MQNPKHREQGIEMNDQPHRPWLRFNLRTLLILLTALSVWLGWNLNTIAPRRQARQTLQTDDRFQLVTTQEYLSRYPGQPPEPLASIPVSRRILGDEAVQEIWYRSWGDTPSTEEIERLARTFPEAEVKELPAPPCHPGCFPTGTLVETPSGPRRIEELVVGDLVISYSSGRVPTAIPITDIFTTDNVLWRIETDHGPLLTTETQPLCLATGLIQSTGNLRPGDKLLNCQQGLVQEATVIHVGPANRSGRVHNLVLGDSQHFVAGGFLVRSKPPAIATDSP